MFAVVETGGKQYRVTLGDSLQIEKLPGVKGDRIEFERVLLVADGDQVTAGTPIVAGARVVATVSRQERGPKIKVFRYKSKKRVRVLTGHRQDLTRIFIRDIVVNGESAAERVQAQTVMAAPVAEAQPEPVGAAEAPASAPAVQPAPVETAEQAPPSAPAAGDAASSEEGA